MRRPGTNRSIAATVTTAVLLLGAAACGSTSKASTSANGGSAGVTLRLGYFPNVTHATAIVGAEKGIFAKALGTNTLQLKDYKDGTAAVEALNAQDLDATYIGSGPAINLFQKSKGSAIRIVSGATSGGASFVVAKDVNSAADLKGKTVSSPKLGNTQDVSLRAWLKSKGLQTTTSGGGDVKINPQDNAQTLDAFKAGQIAGAWVPEPWATRLVVEGGGKVLVDERDLYPSHQFVTTHLVVAKAFLDAHPDVVKQLIEGQVEANDYVNAHSAEAKTIVNAGIKKLTGKDLKPAVIDGAWKNLAFTDDPIVASLQKAATDAKAAGLSKSDDVTGIYDLSILNAVLKAHGKPTVAGP
ncbi:MAG: ABC-type probable sulfate transporter periplasmic binding protein [Acidimicrobiales bacterium]|nr:ABC-type probable sulfate transporter periplasmic binding protein [Acidimicrobiales bacterium]